MSTLGLTGQETSDEQAAASGVSGAECGHAAASAGELAGKAPVDMSLKSLVIGYAVVGFLLGGPGTYLYQSGRWLLGGVLLFCGILYGFSTLSSKSWKVTIGILVCASFVSISLSVLGAIWGSPN